MTYFGNLTKLKLALILGIAVLVSAACSSPPQPDPGLEETAQVESGLGLAPTATFAYQTAPAGAITAAYDGVSFWFSPDIAGIWSAEYIPEGPGSTTSAGPVSHTDPAHLIFHLNNYVRVTPEYTPNIQGWIYIYPAPAMGEQNSIAGGRIAGLTDYLASPPGDLMDQTEQIPFLPLINGSQVFHSQVKFLDFQNGTGVRFITTIAQGFVPIGIGGIFYTFQGMTADGAFYVAMIMPLANTVLNEGPPDGYMSDPVNYVTGIAEQLDRQPANSFTPDLSALDDLVGSLLVRP